MVSLIYKLDGAVESGHTLVTNSSLVSGLRRGLSVADDVVDNIVTFIQQILSDGAFTSLVDGGTRAVGSLVRGALERRHAKCQQLAADTALMPNATNETVMCRNTSTRAIDVIEGTHPHPSHQ